jgi:cyclopropane-fatty-acyl-phospholipid synthase
MTENILRKHVESMLDRADIGLEGKRPWDIQIKNKRLFQRVLAKGSLGFGEAYMDGWWETESLDQLVTRLIKSHLDDQFKSLIVLLDLLRANFFNRQSSRRAYMVGKNHYDIGNDLYRSMLDSRMIYSCGYWRNAENLEDAQRDKLELTCQKLHLEPGQKVLDVGCGWGGAARYIAKNYGVEVVGVTISREQAKLAEENCRNLPVEIRLQDYRDLEGQYDRIFSIGMFEHVGYKNFHTYFEKISELLKDDGLFLLHTIGGNTPAKRTDPWIERYIFPNGVIPSAQQISSSFEGYFVLEDWHNFGHDYDRTLMAWYENFKNNWPVLQEKYDERFHRMWSYYLLASAGSFRARENQLWQIVLAKEELAENYRFPR